MILGLLRSAVLVEPNGRQLDLARRAQERYIDPYNDGQQTGCYLRAAMTGASNITQIQMHRSNDPASMESFIDLGQRSKRQQQQQSRSADSADSADSVPSSKSEKDEKRSGLYAKREARRRRAREQMRQGGQGLDRGRSAPSSFDSDADTFMVPVYPVAEVVRQCNVPNRFGILSVDAEGVGDKVLHAWIDAG